MKTKTVLPAISCMLMLVAISAAQEQEQEQPASKFINVVSVGVSLPSGAFGKTTGMDAGAAETGFALNYSVILPVDMNLAVYFGGELSVNGFNTAGTTITKAGEYVSSTFLVGLGPNLEREDLTFAVAPVIGLFSGSTPELEDPTMKMTSATAYTLCYGATITLIYKNIGIGVHYISAKPEYKFTLPSGGSITVKQPSDQIFVTAGYAW